MTQPPENPIIEGQDRRDGNKLVTNAPHPLARRAESAKMTMCDLHIEATRLAATAEGGRMTDRNGLTEPPAEPRALLGLLYGVIEEAERYEGCLQGTDRIHDRELADFLRELRDETRSRARSGRNPPCPAVGQRRGPVNHRRLCPTEEPRLLSIFL
jgi:hypothetical protein